MKKIFCLSSIIILLISLGMQPAFADTEGPSISLNGTQLEMKASVQEGSLYLPVRSISEDLGCGVNWSQTDQTVGIDAKDKTISLDLRNTKINVNGHESYMLYTPVMINDRTYMREDFFSDDLALKVQWDKNNNTVVLTSMKENAITIKTVRISSETKALKTAIQYPLIEGLADQKIQDEINAVFKNLADQAAQEGAKNAADLAPAVILHPDMPGQCEIYFNYQIKYNQNGLLSLVFQNYQYAGGAHGNTVQSSYTMNLKTGQHYTLKDLFKANADYISIISNSVKTQLDERDLTAALFQPFSKINENQGYYLSNNGVVVYFQQYEILPYTEGIQGFTVDYSLLKDLLKEPDLTKDNPNEDMIDATFLYNIMDLAKQGKVINCIYPANTTVIDDVINAWGKPATSEYIFAAKGTYVGFPAHKVAFGFNKGSQIFEVQNIDDSLQNITSAKVSQAFGNPAFKAESNGQEIIGYGAGTDYKLIMYFNQNPDQSGNTELEHYSVLFPRGTINLMADDPGRDWPVVNAGDLFSVILKGNETTGFTWHYTIENDAILQPLSKSSVPDSSLIGAGSTFTWDFKALKAGNSKIIFKYYRPWVGESSTLPQDIITYNISVADTGANR